MILRIKLPTESGGSCLRMRIREGTVFEISDFNELSINKSRQHLK